MKKIKLKKPHNFLTLIIILIILGIVFLFNFIGNHITPIIINYAEKQARKVAIAVIIASANAKIMEIDTETLFKETKDGIDYNPAALMKALEQISKNVRLYLKKIENGKIDDLNITNISYINVSKKKQKKGIIYEVPTGIIFNNGLLANLGPKIPVRLNLIGDITTDIKTNIKEYGINNALIEISVNVKVTEQVVLPFDTKEIKVETNIPLAIKVIKGDVPGYYMSPYTLTTK